MNQYRYRTSSVGAFSPIVAGYVAPLKDAMSANEILGQFVVGLEHLVAWAWKVAHAAIFTPENEVIEAVLGHLSLRIVVVDGARAELKISSMVSRQLDFYGYDVASSIAPHDYALAVLATHFVGSWLRFISLNK